MPNAADRLDERWMPTTKAAYNDELTQIKDRSKQLWETWAFVAYSQAIDEALNSTIYNISSCKMILRELSEDLAFLERHDKLTQEILDKARKVRERVAWHRAKRN